jgi:hypothetical protein
VVSRTGELSANLVLGGRTFPIKGDVLADGSVRFGRTGTPTMPLIRPGASTLTLALVLDTAAGTDVLLGLITDGNAVFATVSADRSAYDARLHPAPPSIARKYTAAFPARSPAQVGLGPSAFPQGDGVGIVTVESSGSLKFIARLADGSPVGFSSALSKANTFPLHVQTDRKQGSLSGEVTFRDIMDVSDFDSLDMTWFKPMDLTRNSYPGGWPNGISADLVGAAFFGAPVLPGLAPPSANGNSMITFSGIGLGSTLEKSLNIDRRSRVKVAGVDDDRLKLRLSARSGVFAANLHDAAGRKRVNGVGVVLQKQGLGTGFFLEDGKSGGILLEAKTP